MNSRRCAALTVLLGAALLGGCVTSNRTPAPGAAAVCPDSPLRVVLASPATLGSSGRIVIKDAAGTTADTIDLAAARQTRLVGGVSLRYQPVAVDGATVTIRPRVTLGYGKTYTVTIEPAVLGGQAVEPWSFSTRAAPPPATADDLTVAADGTGDFCTVQGAIDFIPAGRPERTTILVRRGIYNELVNIPQGKDRITLRGEDRHQSVIAGLNNAVLNPRHRTMMGVTANDIVIQNLTLRNLTPKGGRQAETLQLRGERCFLVDDDFYSFQDTLQLNGGVDVKNCFIAGDVDFIWGSGTVFFDRCTLRALNNGFLVQSRNGANRLGYIFSDCTIETAPGATHVVLARIHPKGYPYSNVAFLHCRLGPGIVPEGWELDQGTDRDRLLAPPPASAAAAAARPEGRESALIDNAQPAPNVHFWEYQSVDLSGQPADVSHRLPCSRQLTEDEAAPLSDATKVLGGWAHALP